MTEDCDHILGGYNQQFLTEILIKLFSDYDWDTKFTEELLIKLFRNALDIKNDSLVRWLCCQTPKLAQPAVIEFAVKENKLPFLKLIFEKSKFEYHKCEYAMTRLCKHAAETGNLSILRYLHENREFPWSREIESSACFGGRLNIIKYAHEKRHELVSDISSIAAAYRRIEILKFLFDNKYKFDELTCRNAARGGSLECLIFAHEIAGCPIDHALSINTSQITRDFECLKYQISRGCKYNWSVLNIHSDGNPEMHDYVMTLPVCV